jgi:hypothetical protein
MASIQLLKNQPLRAKATFQTKELGTKETVTVQAGKLWTVLAPEGNEAVITAVAGVPSLDEATIRISLVEPGFSEYWELA